MKYQWVRCPFSIFCSQCDAEDMGRRLNIEINYRFVGCDPLLLDTRCPQCNYRELVLMPDMIEGDC